MTSTSPSEVRRVVTKTRRPLREGRAATPQRWFNDACICANTVVAANRRAVTPITVGSTPASTIRERSTAFCTVCEASAPTQSVSRAAILPRAASSPKTAPMMAMRIDRRQIHGPCK